MEQLFPRLSTLPLRSLSPRLLLLLCLAFAGCASPGVVQIAPNTYLLSRSSAAGAFANTTALKAGVLRDANAFAASQGKVVVPISLNENRPSVGFPSCDFQFLAVTPEEAQRLADLQMKQREDQVRAWNSLTPAQRIQFTLEERELQQRDRALSDAESANNNSALQSELDRDAYDQRTHTLQQPANVNLNVNGTVNQNVNGTIGVYHY